jgi:hypothetical protein
MVHRLGRIWESAAHGSSDFSLMREAGAVGLVLDQGLLSTLIGHTENRKKALERAMLRQRSRGATTWIVALHF